MIQRTSVRRLVLVLVACSWTLVGHPPASASMQPASAVLGAAESVAVSSVDDEAPDELPLSEDEGAAAFWRNVRRFALVIAIVSGLFYVWARVEKNRDVGRGDAHRR